MQTDDVPAVMTTQTPVNRRESSAMIKLADRIKRFVPAIIKNALSNCGGINRRPERFAGCLLDKDLHDERYLAILHSLITPAGIRKTTTRNRSVEILTELSDRGVLPDRRGLKVLDIGASAGLDSLSTLAFLRQRYEVEVYVLGDLFTAVLYDPSRGLIFDENGQLLQVERKKDFVSINFSYNYAFQKITNLGKRLHAQRLSKRYRFNPQSVVRLPLVHRDVNLNSAESPFRLKRMSVFDPLSDRYDLIICMHLLVRRYFSEDRIAQAIENLSNALTVGGTLISGSAETVKVVVRRGESLFDRQTCP